MMLMTRSKGQGDSVKRVMLTKPEANVEVKCPILSAPREIPIESALADIFKLWGVGAPETTPAASSNFTRKL